MNYLIINLKTYQESTGKNAIKIAKSVKELEEESKKKNVRIILCPQAIDIKEIIKEGVNVFAQHIDNYDYGAHTGFSIPHALKDIGVCGTLISHSEHILDLEQIEKEIKVAKELGLISCVCARDDKTAEEISKFKPDLIAVEPKELIGGDISISTANPELISSSVSLANPIPLLVGAGVKNSTDVKKALELGSKGILVASGVVKAKNPKDAIRELLEGF